MKAPMILHTYQTVLAVSSTNKNLPSVNVQNNVVVCLDGSQRQIPELNGNYCARDGICSHEVLGREDSTSELPNLLDEKKMLTKVCFLLSSMIFFYARAIK